MGKNSDKKNLQRVLSLLENRKSAPWKSSLEEILDSFENFLIERPPIPPAWAKRFEENPGKFDYYQIVLPEDFQDPFEDDLGNLRRLREAFSSAHPTIALEYFLVSRNHFIYDNGHATLQNVPRPILMLESLPQENSTIDWDCYISIFADGSYIEYNLDRDDEEELGDNIQDILESRMEILSQLSLSTASEGFDE